MKEIELKKIVNRCVDAIYLSSIELKLDYETFTKIVRKLEDLVFVELYKNHSTFPYRKKSYLEPVYLDITKNYDIKEYINRLSLTLRDVLIMIESHRDYISRVKEKRINNVEFLKNYKKSFNDIAAVLITYNDILLEMLDCDNEDQMNEVLKKYFSDKGIN